MSSPPQCPLPPPPHPPTPTPPRRRRCAHKPGRGQPPLPGGARGVSVLVGLRTTVGKGGGRSTYSTSTYIHIPPGTRAPPAGCTAADGRALPAAAAQLRLVYTAALCRAWGAEELEWRRGGRTCRSPGAPPPAMGGGGGATPARPATPPPGQRPRFPFFPPPRQRACHPSLSSPGNTLPAACWGGGRWVLRPRRRRGRRGSLPNPTTAPPHVAARRSAHATAHIRIGRAGAPPGTRSLLRATTTTPTTTPPRPRPPELRHAHDA